MVNSGSAGAIHPATTKRSGYQYLFHIKHHNYGAKDVAQWLPDLSRLEEFSIFDRADELDLSSASGDLYGLRIDSDNDILALGTLGQQVAKFPHAHASLPWHGYPLGPLANTRPPHPPIRPLPREAIQKMVDQKLLTATQMKRLLRGNHV